jgi:hydrogenase maturation protease
VSAHTLVAGIGNVFLSDDAFGVEVAQRLAERPLPEGVRAEDYGIRGIHLAYELLEGYDTLVLIDAVPIGQPPGTLAVIEPEVDEDPGAPDLGLVDAHTMSPDVVLATLARLGGRRRRRRRPVPRGARRRRRRSSTRPTRRRRYPKMIRRFVASLILAAVAGLVIRSLPDIARYLKMREM